MSLIVDALKKLNRDKDKNSQIPPSLKEDKGKSKSLLPYLIGLFVVVSLFAGGFVYYIYNINKDNVIYEHPKITQAYKIPQKNIKKQTQNLQINKTLEKNNQKINSNIVKNKNNKREKSKNIKISKKENIKTPPPIKANSLKSQKNTNTKIPPPKIFTEQDYVNLLNQANLYLEQGNYLKVIKIYEKIVRYKNDNDILNNLLVLYVKTGQENKILNYTNKINENILLNITLELINYGKIEKAKFILDKISKKGINGYLSYAILYEKSGYLDKAMKYYKLAYNENPENPLYGYYYARALEMNKKYKKAYFIYNNILKSKVENKNLKNIIKNRIKILSTLSGE